MAAVEAVAAGPWGNSDSPRPAAVAVEIAAHSNRAAAVAAAAVGPAEKNEGP